MARLFPRPPVPPVPPPSNFPPYPQTFSPNVSLPVSTYPEIYDLTLHFAFIPHLPPIALRNRIEEPPSLAPLLGLTLVSKGLRELVLPRLYKNVVIRRSRNWTLLLHPTEGLLVGAGEEQTKRRSWIKRLSFAQNIFPSSWTPSRYRPAGSEPLPELVMAPLDFSPLGGLEEVCVGPWRIGKAMAEEKNKTLLLMEKEEGPYSDHLLETLGSSGTRLRRDEPRSGHALHPVFVRMEADIGRRYFEQQCSSLLALFDHTRPSLFHLSLSALRRDTQHPSSKQLESTFSIFVHSNPLYRTRSDYSFKHQTGARLRGGGQVQEVAAVVEVQHRVYRRFSSPGTKLESRHGRLVHLETGGRR